MKSTIHGIIFFCFLLVLCCKGSLNEKQSKLSTSMRIGIDSTFNTDFIFELTADTNSLYAFHRDTLVVLYFDGQCSTCLAAFFNFLNLNKVNENYSYIYIVEAYDLELLEFYLDREKKILKENEYLLFDRDNTFKFFHPNIKTELLPIVTIDPKQRVISAQSLYDLHN